MQDRLIKKLWHTNRKCFIEEFSILQTINSEGNIEHTYFERSPKGELSRLSTCQINEVPCSGKKDKNGNLIFEGDILKDKETGCVVTIEFNRFSFNLMANVRGMDDIVLLEDIYYTGKEGTPFEIIGNIYENPELLKGASNDD